MTTHQRSVLVDTTWRSLVIVLAVVMTCGGAGAYWNASAAGSGSATAATVDRGARPSASVTGEAVTIAWPVTMLSTGESVSGYLVTRFDAETFAPQVMGASCAWTVTAATCTESAVPDGSWVYTVTPVIGQNWRGEQSPPSEPVTLVSSDVPLASAGRFSVLAATGVTSTGSTFVSGDLGVSPSTSVVGFPPGIVGGDLHAGDSSAAQAQADLLTAYEAAAGLDSDGTFAGDQSGQTFLPGVWHTASAFGLTGTVTLDAKGDPDAVFVFQVDAALNTAAASHVVLVNGAKASNVYWQVLGAVGTGADSTFAGTILTRGSITLGLGTRLVGQALSLATVTLAGNTISFTASPPPTFTLDGGATRLTKDTTPAISGTSDAVGRTVTVKIGTQTLTTTVSADGTWTVVTAALAAGTYDVIGTVRSASGDTGSATQQITVEVNPSPVVLGSAAAYSVLGGTGVSSSGPTILAGSLGSSPSTSITGFPPGVVYGSIHAGDALAAEAQDDAGAAYTDAAARPAGTNFAGDRNGTVVRPGVHRTTAAFALTGTMTFDADGDPDAVFIIQVGAALNTAAASQVVLVNGAQASNIYWQVLGAAGLGADSDFAGTILAKGAITLGAGTRLAGRALSVGTVTLASNAVTAP